MIDAFMQKAGDNLAAARLCFENALYDASAGRAYFAAFQAAVAALLHMELVRYASEKAMDILCDYGYQFLIMPTKRAELQPF